MTLEFISIEYPPSSGTFQACGGTTDYRGYFTVDRPYGGMSSDINRASFANNPSLLESIAIGGRVVPITFVRDPGGAVSHQTFQTNLMQWFSPSAKSSSGTTTRLVRVFWHDGSTQLVIPVTILSVDPRGNASNIVDVQAEAVIPYFRETSQTTNVITTSGTATNDGNHRAPVTIELNGSNINGNRITVTDNTGRGLSQYPLLLTNSTTTTFAQTFVLVNGKSVPTKQGSTTQYFWVYVDIPPSGSITCDIIYTSGVTNPLADTEDTGNIYVSHTATTSLIWDLDQYGILTAPPNKSGQWYPKRWLNTGSWAADLGYEMTQSGSAGSYDITFTATNARAGESNNANAMIVQNAIEAGATSALANFRRDWVNKTSLANRAFVRYRAAGSRTWVLAWDTDGGASSGTVTTSIDLDDAVEIVAGVEMVDATANPGTDISLTIDNAAASTRPTLTFDTTKDVSTSSTAKTWDLLNGSVANSTTGDTITFSNHIFPDGTSPALTINTDQLLENRGITYSGSGPVLNPPTFSNNADWLQLNPGSNTITESVNSTATVRHYDSYG